MFCTECGTQIDQGKKFCRNCGARVGAAVEPTAAIPTESSEDLQRRAQPIPAETTRANGGTKNLLIVAAGIAVVVLGAAGVYFGTDLFRPTTLRTPASVPEPPAKTAEAPALPRFEDTKDAGAIVADNPPQTSSPQPATAVERPKLPLETLPRGEAPPPARSQIQGAGQEPPPARVTRPPGSTPATAAGIYETMRATTVYEDPSASSKVLASIGAGTRITVVGSNGEWLEVHSKRGNPPGFIRRGDATFVEKLN